MPKLEPLTLELLTKADPKALDQTEKKLRGFSEKVTSASQKFAIGVGVAGTAIFGLGVKAAQAAGEQEQLGVAFTTMLGDAEKAKTLMGEIADFASATPFELTDIQKGSKALLAFGIEADNVIPSMKNLGDIASGVGINIDELAVIYGKARTAGTLYAEDVNQLTERGIPIIAQLAKQFGVAEGEIKKLVSEGKVGFGDLEEAFSSMSGEGGQFHNLMEAQSETLLGKWSNLQDGVHQLMVAIGERLLPVATQFVDAVIAFLPKLQQMADWLSQNKEILLIVGGAILAGLVPAFIVATGAALGFIATMAPLWIAGAAIAGIAILIYKAWNENFLGVRDAVQGVVSWFTDTFLPALQGMFDWMKEKLDWLVNNWAEAVGFIIGFFATLPIKLPILALVALSKIIELVKNIDWGNVFKVILDGAGKIFNAIFDAGKKLWEKLQAIDWGALFKNIAKGIGNSVLGLIEGAIKGALSGIPGIGDFSLPRFANGVNNFGGGLAITGERGPELVNLPQGSSVTPAGRTQEILSNSRQERPIVVNQYIQDSVDLTFAFREIAYALKTA
jgi:tape measure domain-containing protein